MKPPQIFPDQPKLTKADATRLLPVIGNARIPLRQWLATNPPVDDLKRAVVLETLRAAEQPRPLASLGRGVLSLLMKRIQQLEYSDVDARIRAALTETKQ